ncbi:MAG: hypothetical protein IJT08_03565 [Alphaproteobacteria bacterium]|nr:hypothetical protein [Alphaproteobacteria bacterium]
MSKLGVVVAILGVLAVCLGIVAMRGGCFGDKSNIGEVRTERKNVVAGDLHKDILRLIASGKEVVCGISPQDAEKELESRSGNEPELDKKPADAKKLPFDILRLIAKSPATIAGIKPKAATNELVRRYLSIDLTDSDDVDSSILLEALQHREEKKAIEDWANNEDAEAVEAFMKEEAERDPSSVANFALGLKKMNEDHATAMTYMDRYANHAHGDAFDNPNEEAAYKKLIEAIKQLK